MYDPCTSATGLQQLRRNQRHAVATMTVLHPAGRINDTLFIYTLPAAVPAPSGQRSNVQPINTIYQLSPQSPGRFHFVSSADRILFPTASELILEWWVGGARPEGPRAGDGVLGKGTASPSPPNRGFAEVL